jgi:hypothetical protein
MPPPAAAAGAEAEPALVPGGHAPGPVTRQAAGGLGRERPADLRPNFRRHRRDAEAAKQIGGVCRHGW